MKDIFSFSEVVNEFQGDKEKGLKFIGKIAETLPESLNELHRAEKRLNQMKGKIKSDLNVVVHICRHLEIGHPIKIRKGNTVYELDSENFNTYDVLNAT